ncbi:MAG: amidohydrolase [Chitinophagales bacterium]|nr:amidohydrolase [Chitinophagales bacterium]
MKADLNITFIQTSLHWQNRKANLEMLAEKIISVDLPTDLILLPEMFTTGFSMSPEIFAETIGGEAMTWMRLMAEQTSAVICGSMMMNDGVHYYNRLIWMRPDGSFEHYDKRHLFGLGEENQHYTRGNKKILVELNGWKILPLICYDLRFPVWSRNSEFFDLILYVANWPERRIYAWKQLLISRAIENQCYVAGVNRVGYDGNEVYHSGNSMTVDPAGEVLIQQEHNETVFTSTLSHQHLIHLRQKYPFLKDQDQFKFES